LAWEQGWPEIEQTIRCAPGLRLAVSEWNLYEIANGTDLAQREKRLLFLDRLGPEWMVERVHIQKQELRRFLWECYYGVRAPDLLVFSDNLSVIDSFSAGSQTRLGLTARRYIAELNIGRVNMRRASAPTALRTLQRAGSKDIAKLDERIFRERLQPLLPPTTPDGRPSKVVERHALVNFCWQNRSGLLATSPALAVEHALRKTRTRDPARNPQASDGPDLMHMVMALAYCDFFVVRDGYALSCARQAKRTLRSLTLAKICESVRQIME
jgi:hypothetical protein